MTPEERAAAICREYGLGCDGNHLGTLCDCAVRRLIASAIRDAEREAAERAWNTVNALIKSGNLEEPYHSERNGLISAANAIRQSQEPKA